MEKEKTFENDFVIVYKCGCREPKMEGDYSSVNYRHCKDHHHFIECDEWSKTCACGISEPI
jgi:hypothetical protein